MSGIHDAAMTYTKNVLQAALIDDIDEQDPARAGVVKIGPLQGDPDPDDARISVTIHENDPQNLDTDEEWQDDVEFMECGGAITWSRKFTVRGRCLFDATGEDLAAARQIASTVLERIEVALLKASFNGVSSGDESVSRGPLADTMEVMLRQSGGPDAYDFFIKVRFDILTTRTGV